MRTRYYHVAHDLDDFTLRQVGVYGLVAAGVFVRPALLPDSLQTGALPRRAVVGGLALLTPLLILTLASAL